MNSNLNENEAVGHFRIPDRRRAEDNTWWGETTGLLPTQGFGAIDGLEWYFRARDGRWYLVVAVPPLSAVETHRLAPAEAFIDEGEGEPYPEEAWVQIR
jgi:hypothetical protein